MKCFVDDDLTVYFDYDKRETIEGHDICFHHDKYIKERQNGQVVYSEDEIPFVHMNICKISFDKAPCKCHEYAYQMKLRIRDIIDGKKKDAAGTIGIPANKKPLLWVEDYLLIDMQGVVNGNLVILPGD